MTDFALKVTSTIAMVALVVALMSLLWLRMSKDCSHGNWPAFDSTKDELVFLIMLLLSIVVLIAAGLATFIIWVWS
jgi:hypothetical protein